MQLKKSGDSVAVKGLASGGPAQLSGQVRVEDIFDMIDGKPASKSVEEVEASLKGWEGSVVQLRLIRVGVFGREIVQVELKRAVLRAVDNRKTKPDPQKKADELQTDKKANSPAFLDNLMSIVPGRSSPSQKPAGGRKPPSHDAASANSCRCWRALLVQLLSCSPR